MARLIPAGASMDPGAVQPFSLASAPRGWLEADGAAVSRALYPRLFAAIGTTYGAGDGSTTFNVPDLRGEFVRGVDNGRGVDSGRALGSSQADENKSHGHGASASTASSHNHGITSKSWTGSDSGAYLESSPNSGSTHSASTTSGGAHGHSISVNASGGAESRPRNVALLYCIKT